MKTLKEIMERLAAIKKDLETRSDLTEENIADLKTESQNLMQERDRLLAEERAAAARAIEESAREGNPVVQNDNEERASKLVETNKVTVRSALLTSGPIAKATAADGIYNNLAADLGLLGKVKVVNRVGYEKVNIAYVKSGSNASAHTDGQVPTESEPVFGVVSITPSPYSLISYVSKSIKRLSPVDYLKEVEGAAREALVAKAEQIILGACASSVDTANTDLVQAVTLTETQIGEHTLRNIVLKFKPGRRFNGLGTLFLTTTQLVAFGAVRGSDKKPVYIITPDASNLSGVIEEGGIKVNYVIDDGLTNILYGYLPAVEFDTFGDTEVEVSSDYKFGEGLLAVRGEAYFGAKLYVNHAFLKVSFTAAGGNGQS